MEDVISEVINLITNFDVKNMATYSTLAMLVIRALRSEDVQEILPDRLKWPKSSLAGKGIALLFSLLITVVGALFAGSSLQGALLMALPVALGAIAGHKGTQALGAEVRAPAPSEVDPGLQVQNKRSLVVKALDLALPPPKSGAE